MKSQTKAPNNKAKLQKALAQRVLARRRLLQFTQMTHPAYSSGWVHDDICRRLEKFSQDIADKKSPRLMLLMPPRHGKSELASIRFPAWHLGHNPTHEIINVGYNLDLPMKFSRKVREVMRDPQYKAIFPDTQLDPDSQSVEAWNTTSGGGFTAAGVGGGITGKGAHCLHPGTLVSTVEGPIAIEHLYQLKSPPMVETPFGPRRVLAASKRPSPGMYTLHFASGAVLRATAEHPVYLAEERRYATVGELYGTTLGDGGDGLRVVREGVSAETLRPHEVRTAGFDGVLLQSGVQPSPPRGEERQTVPDVLPAGSADAALQELPLLQYSVPASPNTAPAQAVPEMRRGVSAEAFRAGLLRGELRERGACGPYARGEELELPHGQRVRVFVRPDEAPNLGAGQRVCGVYDDDSPSALSPHRRGPGEQHSRESDHALCEAPHGAPQICYDTLLMVAGSSSEPDFVYDVQVEEAGCFFAEGVLVGNCLIIDDPIKNQEEADSVLTRDKLWDWYQSTAYTRLAPGGGVLCIETWWSDDDLAGRLQQAMGKDPEADQFEIIRYPALSEHWEYRDELTNEILRLDAEIDVTNPPLGMSTQLTLLRPKDTCLHEERYPTDSLKRIRANLQPRIWSALYQQNPVPDEGMYFKKEFFRYQRALPAPNNLRIYTAWDFAIGEKTHNDWTVGATILQDDTDTLYVLDIHRMKGDSFQIIEAMLDVAERWGQIPGTGYLMGAEDGQIWRAMVPMLKKRMAERKQYPPYEVLRPLSDKLARARPLQGRMQQGRIVFPEEASWLPQAEQELLRFPAGAHDDVVDALAWAVHLCIGKEPPRLEEPAPLPSWRDKLTIMGGGGSHMSA